jgi:hypothetical protein
MYKGKGFDAAAIGFKGDVADDLCKTADYAEISTNLKVPQNKGKLKLQVFIANYTKDNNFRAAKPMRYNEFYAGKKLLWKELFQPESNGGKWYSFDVSSIAKAGEDLKLTYKVTNSRWSRRYHTVGLIGRVRLVETE